MLNWFYKISYIPFVGTCMTTIHQNRYLQWTLLPSKDLDTDKCYPKTRTTANLSPSHHSSFEEVDAANAHLWHGWQNLSIIQNFSPVEHQLAMILSLSDPLQLGKVSASSPSNFHQLPSCNTRTKRRTTQTFATTMTTRPRRWADDDDDDDDDTVSGRITS